MKKKQTPKKSASKKTHKPTVRGPQLALKGIPQAKERDDGNPLVAFRAPGKVVNAFVKKHGSRRDAWKALVAHMERAA